jgi:hypothetical protein
VTNCSVIGDVAVNQNAHYQTLALSATWSSGLARRADRAGDPTPVAVAGTPKHCVWGKKPCYVSSRHADSLRKMAPVHRMETV